MSIKSSLLMSSTGAVLPLLLNPLVWVGAAAGALIGWGICWIIFVLPFQKNLAEREGQLDHWSQLNQQLQQQTMDNRNMSQAELKQFIASDQEASAAYAEIQRRLQQRELRLSETPTYFVLIPIAMVTLTFCGVVLLFKAMNQRALQTMEDVIQLAPPELVQTVVARHVALTVPSVAAWSALPSAGMLPTLKVNSPDETEPTQHSLGSSVGVASRSQCNRIR